MSVRTPAATLQNFLNLQSSQMCIFSKDEYKCRAYALRKDCILLVPQVAWCCEAQQLGRALAGWRRRFPVRSGSGLGWGWFAAGEGRFMSWRFKKKKKKVQDWNFCYREGVFFKIRIVTSLNSTHLSITVLFEFKRTFLKLHCTSSGLTPFM